MAQRHKGAMDQRQEVWQLRFPSLEGIGVNLRSLRRYLQGG